MTKPMTLRLDFDLVGTDVITRFADLLNETNRNVPVGEQFTPSQLAASLIASILTDDAGAHEPVHEDNVVSFRRFHS